MVESGSNKSVNMMNRRSIKNRMIELDNSLDN